MGLDDPLVLTEATDLWLGLLPSASMSARGGMFNIEQSEFWGLLDSLPVAILLSTDRDCRRISGNAAARALFGLSEHDNFSASAPDDERPAYQIFANGVAVEPAALPMQVAARTGRPVPRSECEIRFADGRRIFIAGHTVPLRNEEGEISGSIGTFVDVTAQKDEVELERLRSDEMAHRLKNTIAIVQAISRRTLRPVIGDELYRAYEDRLMALRAFQSLVNKNNWSGAIVSDIVETMIAAAAAAIRDRISVQGPHLTLPVEATMAVSMILHELVTNAGKYGALSDAKGKVKIEWRCVPSGKRNKLYLDWIEYDGPPVAAPRAAGFGKVMMEAVCKGLKDGHLKLDFDPAGVRAQLSFLLGGDVPEGDF